MKSGVFSLIGWVVVLILSVLTYSLLAAQLDFGYAFEDIGGVATITIFILIAQLIHLPLLIFVFHRKFYKLAQFNLSIIQIALVFTLISLIINLFTRYLTYNPSKGAFLLIGLNAAYTFIVLLFIARKQVPNNAARDTW